MIQVASSQTWGELPADWNFVKVAHVVRIPNGLVDPTDERYAGLRLIAPNHIESHTARLTAWQSAEEQGASSGKYLVQEGDLVYSKIRPKLNKVAVAPERCLCSADMYPIRPRGELFVSDYLLYVMLSAPFWKRTVDESMRVAMPKVNRDSLGAIRVPVPPLPIQRAIASFLDRETARIDTLIAKKRRLLDLLEEKRTALITRAVTWGLNPDVPMKDSGVEWIGEIPVHWGVAPVNALADLINGYPFDSANFHPSEGTPLIRIRDLDSDSTAAQYNAPPPTDVRVETGDIIIGMDGDFNVSRWRGRRALLNQRMCSLHSKAEYNPAFLYYSLPRPLKIINDLTHSTTVKHLSSGQVRSIRVPVPPRAEQDEIARFLEEAERARKTMQQQIFRAIELLREYRSALISAAVTGKVDVRNAVPA